MTRFRHDLILRMIKLLDAVLVTIPLPIVTSITQEFTSIPKAKS